MAGIATHTMVASEVMKQPNAAIVKKYINGYEQYFRGGARFPDWGYVSSYSDWINKANTILKLVGVEQIPDCKSVVHQAGEDSHWSPFLIAGALYLKNLGKKWTEPQRQLAAFLFGIMTHNIVDTRWHEYSTTKNINEFYGDVLVGPSQVQDTLIPVEEIVKVYKTLTDCVSRPYTPTLEGLGVEEGWNTQKKYIDLLEFVENNWVARNAIKNYYGFPAGVDMTPVVRGFVPQLIVRLPRLAYLIEGKPVDVLAHWGNQTLEQIIYQIDKTDDSPDPRNPDITDVLFL